MEFDEETLLINREISDLDMKVYSFVDLFEESGIDYVLVSGYVSILAGRSRGTEDVDVIIEELDREEIDNFVRSVSEKGYWSSRQRKTRKILKKTRRTGGFRWT